jgi:hypothetical protein
MKLHKLKADLDALQRNEAIFDEKQFNARKEALNFIAMIEDLYLTHDAKRELVELYDRAQELHDQILTFNNALFNNIRGEIVAGARGQRLRVLLAPFTKYTSEDRGLPHYGYENLDVLVEGVLMPLPHPDPTLERAYGMVRYEPTPISVILELFDQLQFSADDVFYDLGSGLGKVVMLVHLLVQIPCIGVEFEPAYYAYAVQRADAMSLREVKFINADTREVDYSDGTVFYLFNPFGGEIFNHVLASLAQVARQHPITVCSYGACTPPLNELPWLEIADVGSGDEYMLAIFSSK